MRILITADPDLPVPPLLYGGIERIIDMLVNGLLSRGHSVALVAHRDSKVACKLFAYPGLNSASTSDLLLNTLHIGRVFATNQFDVVHSFGRLASLFTVLPTATPKLMTYQREITAKAVIRALSLSRGSLEFSAISDWMYEHVQEHGRWHRVFNGVDLHKFDYVASVSDDAPLVFLGRIEPIKGTHNAIAIAKAAGRKLVIAGNISPGFQNYFDKQVAPFVDGHQIQYIGPVDDAQKNNLLNQALAFLMPIEWEEPFGIVMAESLACGTPIIGFGRGAVPEIVRDGANGFVCSSVESAVSAVLKVSEISRENCRRDAEARFSADVIVEEYLTVYQNMLRRRGRFASL